MMNYYLRIGDFPQDGKSKIYQWNDKEHSSRTVVGEEKGISVYKTTKVSDRWKVILPNNPSSSTIDTFKYLQSAVLNNQKFAYIVTGDEIGIGYDGEPVITNIKIIEDITEDLKRDFLEYNKIQLLY